MTGEPRHDEALRGVLLSIHLTSNRPGEFRLFLDRLQETTHDPRSVEVALKIDDSDAAMNAVLAEETKRRARECETLG